MNGIAEYVVVLCASCHYPNPLIAVNYLDFWEWRDDSGWKAYSVSDSNAIEQAFSSGSSIHHLNIGRGVGYDIDFSRMVQTNLRTQFSRMVRRSSSSKFWDTLVRLKQPIYILYACM